MCDFDNVSSVYGKVDRGRSRRRLTTMNSNGQQWTTMDNNGQQWITMDNNGQQWTTMDSNGQQWTTMDNYTTEIRLAELICGQPLREMSSLFRQEMYGWFQGEGNLTKD